MAKVVDKEKKRKQIALCCKELIVKNPINNITVSELAKAANIGKGTVYEYFENKEEIVFELTDTLIQQHLFDINEKLLQAKNIKEKIEILSSFYYDEESYELREIYKKFIAISITDNNKDVKEFQKEATKIYLEKFMEILDEAIKNGYIKEEAKIFAKTVFDASLGIFLQNVMSDSEENIKKEMNMLIENFLSVVRK